MAWPPPPRSQRLPSNRAAVQHTAPFLPGEGTLHLCSTPYCSCCPSLRAGVSPCEGMGVLSSFGDSTGKARMLLAGGLGEEGGCDPSRASLQLPRQ